MGIFDFNTNSVTGCNKVKDECIIALKVYDACRQQDCLESGIIGPARAAVCGTFCSGITLEQGEIITPPENAAAVTVSDFKVEKVVVVSKTQNPFRVGYWDVDLKYVFSYDLVFKNVNGGTLCTIPAQSVFNKKVTLFGSITTDSLVSTDFLSAGGNSFDTSSQPFVLVESKAVALSSELVYDNCCCCNDGAVNADHVNITIGLFTIVKLFRLVNLSVESKGFCIPGECEDVSNINPCEFFDNLDFPMDIFAPPQKREFLAGISGNIPAEENNSNSNCGCGCNNNNNTSNNNNSCGCNNSCNCGCGCNR
ncbi:MAG: hypothetical protein Q4F63_05335 [Clostridia bacterium]|nr:hypothetical protein [Clostridia bacterium]